MLLILSALLIATLLHSLQLLTTSPGMKGANFNIFSPHAQAQRAAALGRARITRCLLPWWTGIPLQSFVWQLLALCTATRVQENRHPRQLHCELGEAKAAFLQFGTTASILAGFHVQK